MIDSKSIIESNSNIGVELGGTGATALDYRMIIPCFFFFVFYFNPHYLFLTNHLLLSRDSCVALSFFIRWVSQINKNLYSLLQISF